MQFGLFCPVCFSAALLYMRKNEDRPDFTDVQPCMLYRCAALYVVRILGLCLCLFTIQHLSLSVNGIFFSTAKMTRRHKTKFPTAKPPIYLPK